jgi:sarcosine oxidase subunit gamma
VAEQSGNGVVIGHSDGLSIVSLKVSSRAVDEARNRMQLAATLQSTGGELQSLWFGPDRWLLVSSTMTPGEIIGECNQQLGNLLYSAVDYSSALAVLSIVGPAARDLLASASGVDFRDGFYPARTCCRTRFAHVAAIIVAGDADHFTVYVDRSFGAYIYSWLTDTAGILHGT